MTLIKRLATKTKKGVAASPPWEVKTRNAWHPQTVEAVYRRLRTSANGLSEREALVRRQIHGANELVDTGGKSVWRLLADQLRSVMILVLLVAGAVAFFLKGRGGELPLDAVAIFFIVILFVVLGVHQEYRAQRAIAALKRMAAPVVRVVREGEVYEVNSSALVPGDVVFLEAGAIVPADCRVIEAAALKTQEASLTGESESVKKTAAEIADESGTLPLGDRRNLLYAGTFVTAGRGKGVVVSTGMATEIGRIAALIQDTPEVLTPLQRRLDNLGKILALIAIVVAIAVAAIGMAFEGKDLATVLILGISIAVAIVPEGLPAVLTVTLALGAQKMLKRRALIRRLPAVETLGSVTVICSDKTGTLTQNRMTVTTYRLPEGGVRGMPIPASDAPPVDREGQTLLLAAALCNDTVERLTASGDVEQFGDPTETALVAAARAYGISKNDCDARFARTAELAFTSDRKLMTTVHALPDRGGLCFGDTQVGSFGSNGDDRYVSVTKGAADKISSLSTALLGKDGPRRITALERECLEGEIAAMASRGIRVLGLACKTHHVAPSDAELREIEQDLTLLGVIGMIDPPRPEAKQAIEKCKSAGIDVVMITGDHPLTARAIASELGISSTEDPIVTGADLESMTVTELMSRVKEARVFARVSPEHKLRIVEALQSNGHIVAMTGDGVNDAPALKKADIGVAMGTGTDVAKEAADMILTDDNFATIVNAVEEGRTVYDNLRRFVMYSIAGNIAKVITVAVAPLIALRAMLTPIQILFSNLLTDGLIGLGLGVEREEGDVMKRPPIRPDEGVLTGSVGRHIAIVGPLIGVAMLVFGYLTWPAVASDADLTIWGTSMFTTLALIQIARAWSSRSFHASILQTGFRGNSLLIAMGATSLVLQLLVVYSTAGQSFFSTVDLSAARLAQSVSMAVLVLLLMEALKAFERNGARHPRRARHDGGLKKSSTIWPGEGAAISR